MFFRDLIDTASRYQEELSVMESNVPEDDPYFQLVSAKHALLQKVIKHFRQDAWQRAEARYLVDMYFLSGGNLSLTYSLMGAAGGKKQASIRSSLSQRSKQAESLVGRSFLSDLIGATRLEEVSMLASSFEVAIAPTSLPALLVADLVRLLPLPGSEVDIGSGSLSAGDVSVSAPVSDSESSSDSVSASESFSWASATAELQFFRQFSCWFVKDRFSRLNPLVVQHLVDVFFDKTGKYQRERSILVLLLTGSISVQEAVSALSKLNPSSVD